MVDIALSPDAEYLTWNPSTVYSGEFSHWNFSRMIRRKLQSLGNDPDDSMVVFFCSMSSCVC